MAEESGLIVPLGLAVLRRACEDARRWQLRDSGTLSAPLLSVTVNLSVRQIEQTDVVADVRRVLVETGLPPKSLVLEITESIMMGEPEVAIERLASLRHLGVRIALDDFGTGFSSFSYLQRLPVDILKIDRAFVAGLTESRQGVSLVEAILTLSRSLNLTTVAEGIEQGEQLDRLRELGCPFGQGYFLGRPCERDQLDVLLRRQQAERHSGLRSTA